MSSSLSGSHLPFLRSISTVPDSLAYTLCHRPAGTSIATTGPLGESSMRSVISVPTHRRTLPPDSQASTQPFPMYTCAHVWAFHSLAQWCSTCVESHPFRYCASHSSAENPHILLISRQPYHQPTLSPPNNHS